MRHGLAVAASMLASAPGILVAQTDSAGATLRGRVVDARTTRALPSVVVVITMVGDTIGRAQTDTGGIFAVSARRSAGAVVHFALLGYRTDSLTTDAATFATPLRVAMTAAAASTIAAVGPTKVMASDFDRRLARRTGGVFITEADIVKQQPVKTSDLFKTLLGISVRDSGGVLQLVSNRGLRASMSGGGGGTPATGRSAGGRGSSAAPGRGVPSQFPFADSTSGPPVDARKCVLRVGLDGHLMDAAFSVDEIPVNSIHGIEAYIGSATIPIEFSTSQSDAPCGIVMIWTRSQARAP